MDLLLIEDNEPPKSSVILRYEFFIVDEGDFINLWTFVWFTTDKCDKRQLELVNKFSKKTQRWDHDAFVIEKFSNFHRCMLKFYFMENFPRYIALTATEDEVECYGYVCETAKVLAERLNYTYLRQPY